MTFNIYVISYDRYNHILTQDYVEYCTYVVRKSQEAAYRSAGVRSILPVEDTEIDDPDKVRNWLLDHAPEDVIAILDDDIRGFRYRLEEYSAPVDPATATMEIERLAQILVDLDLGFCAGPGHTNLMYYDRPFRFTGIVNSMKIFNLERCSSRFDQRYAYLSDDDFEFQELLTNRVILLADYFLTKNGISSTGSTESKEIKEDAALMKSKWGSSYKEPKGNSFGKIMVRR